MLLNKLIAHLAFVSIISLGGCAEVLRKDKLDALKGWSYEDYRKKLLIEEEYQEQEYQDTALEIKPILAEPEAPLIGSDKIVSISVNEDIPLKDVLIELSRLAEVDIEIDPKIKGGIILRANNRSFNEVIERISNLAGLRYRNNNGILRVENDNPYITNYNLDFLNIVRSNTSRSGVSTIQGTSTNSGGSGSSGSSSTLNTSYEGDLWKSIEVDINKIIIQNFNYNEQDSKINSNVANSQLTEKSAGNYISINKQASLISVYATNKQHNLIKNYLNKVKESASSQVLIEAKIIEVQLKDNYQTGINWSELNKRVRKGIGGAMFAPSNLGVGATRSQLGLLKKQSDWDSNPLFDPATGTFSTSNMKLLVDMTQMFGTTKTLSSPRLHAMNNQQAVLSFVQNKIYFTLQATSNSTSSNNNITTTNNQISVNSTLNTVPVGIILTLQPSINLEQNEVTLNIRPTITKLTGDVVSDPAVAFIVAQAGNNAKNLTSTVPVVETKELDSIMKIKSGQIMVIGGMIENTAANTDNGTPFIMSLPVVGNLFKNTAKSNSLTQTVIFIKATIIPTNRILKQDIDFYNNFVSDKEVKI